MARCPRLAIAWLLLAVVACGDGDEPSDGFNTLGAPGGASMGGATGWGDGEDGTGPSAADWNDVDESSGDGGTTGGDGAAESSGGGGAASVGSSGGVGDDDDDDDTMSTSAGSSGGGGPMGNPFEGDYEGNASGSCNLIGNVSGNWTITVHADGSFDGSINVSGPIGNVGFDGTVSDDGSVVTNDGDCGFLGQIEADGTSGGDFTCDAGCNGTWSGNAA